MYSGTIRNQTRRANELWALLVGLTGVFLENEECVELESDNWEAIKEWDEYKWFHDPNHANVIQQLNQRKEDPNLTLVVRPIDSSQNALARYLAEVGSWQCLRLVVIRRLFGEVKELWMLDMGLGTSKGEFRRLFGEVKELWMLDMGLGTSKGEFEALSEDEYEDWLWERRDGGRRWSPGD